MTETIVRMGPKGQILIKKEYREKIGLKPGNYAETILERCGILILPINTKKELQSIHEIRHRISKKWPKNVDCVDAVREQRR